MTTENPHAAHKIVDDLNLTTEELQKLTKAFKDPEFKKIFQEYAEEISNPENKKRYEEEIRQLESERGMDVKFINPTPGYTLKTFQNGKDKVFINICHSDVIGKPSVKKGEEGGKVGAVWSIPHSLSNPREDVDKSRKLCVVYDTVFHPDTFYMTSKNVRFRELVESTALKGIESRFNVTLDHKNVRRPKLKFKGVPQPTVIRTKREDYDTKQALLEEKSDDLIGKFPYPYSDTQPTSSSSLTTSDQMTEQKIVSPMTSQSNSGYAEPKYFIRYSENFDIQKCRSDSSTASDRPDRAIITIELPLLKSASCIDLDIKERLLVLHVEKPVAYHLEVKLSYPVLEEEGSAKFDKSTKCLIVTLPIVKQNLKQYPLDTVIKTETVSKDTEHLPEKLIEVIHSEDVQQSIDDNEPHNLEDQSAEEISISVKSSDDLNLLCKYQKPFSDLRMKQDHDAFIVCCFVKGVLNDKNVRIFYNSSDTLKTDENGKCILIQCTSLGKSGGCFPLVFGVLLEINEEDVLLTPSSSSARVHVKVQEDSVIIYFPKQAAKMGYWREIHYRHTLDDEWLVRTFPTTLRHESTLQTVSQLIADQTKVGIREEYIGLVQFASMEESHSSQSSATSEDEICASSNKLDDSGSETTSMNLSDSFSEQHFSNQKGDSSGKASKKKKKNGKSCFLKEKRPSRNRELIAEEEKLFSALEPIDQQSIPKVEFSNTSHLQCNGILKHLRSESSDGTAESANSLNQSLNNQNHFATNDRSEMILSDIPSGSRERSRTGSVQNSSSLPKTVSFPKVDSHLVDMTWFDGSESVAQLRKRLQSRRNKQETRRCRRRSHNIPEEDERPAPTEENKSTFRSRSFSETEVHYLKMENSSHSVKDGQVTTFTDNPEQPNCGDSKKVVWREVKSVVPEESEIKDVNSGEIIRDHRTECRVDLSNELVFELDDD